MTFKKNETYLHRAAIMVLTDWLKDDFIRIVPEEMFCMEGFIWFVPDLTCYDNKGIKLFIEVVFTNEVDIFKQWNIYKYIQIHNWPGVELYTISAEWILKQTKKPEVINFSKILTERDEF